ncbi:DUF305 domain-containing protein [Avibacterium gallinarum]|uniref:CopM family metallochaperone n=1 Tax=Avibacterium gallinarum TaxID=755 RepID=UPI003BF8E598
MKKALLILISLISSTAMAEMQHHHTAHQPNAMQSELMASMSAMHADMEKGMQYQDADVAFAASMLPHHEGAVKMAEIELKYGKDPELRQLAENIINAQQSEIQFMQQWLEKHQAKQ